MGLLKKILLAFFLVTLLLFAGLSVFVHQNGQSIIEHRLSEILNRQVKIGKVRVLFPLGLRFDDVQIKGAMTAKVAKFKFGIPLFFGDHFNVSKMQLTDAVFFITRTADSDINWGAPRDPAAVAQNLPKASVQAHAAPIKETARGIIVDFLEIDNGTLNFEDQARDLKLQFDQVQFRAISVPFPVQNITTRMDFTAKLGSSNVPFSGRKVEGKGTFNIPARNMDAVFKVIDHDGQSAVSAALKSINNEMMVKGKINVGRFISGVKTPESAETSLEGFVGSVLESAGVDIGVDFVCNTLMDNFKCDKLSIGGTVTQSN